MSGAVDADAGLVRVELTAASDLDAVLGGLEDAARSRGTRGVELVPAGLVLADDAVADLRAAPGTRVATAPLLEPGAGEPGGSAAAGLVVLDAGRVVAVGTALHRTGTPTDRAVGPLVVAPVDVPAALAAVQAVRDAARRAGWRADPFDLALLGLVRAGVAVRGYDVSPFVAGRATDEREAEELRAAAQAQDVHAVRSVRVARGDDGLVSTLALRPVSRLLRPWAVRLGLTPDAVTSLSFVLGLAAAVALAVPLWWVLVLAALLAWLSLVLDCVDGEVARWTRRFTAFGGWYDAVTDRVKEVALLVGLAVGGWRLGHETFLLLTAAVVLQGLRHAMRAAFVDAVLDPATAPVPDTRPLEDLGPPVLTLPPRRPRGAGLRALTPGQWVRRVLHAPVSERWTAAVLGALVAGPLGGLVAYVALAVVSTAWTTVGWVRRTPGIGRLPRGAAPVLEALRDDGVLGLRRRPSRPEGALGEPSATASGSAWRWLVVPVVVVVEGAVALWAVSALRAGGHATNVLGPALVALVAFLAAWHRYEVAHRMLRTGAGVGRSLSPGWAVRTGVTVLATVLAGAPSTVPVLLPELLPVLLLGVLAAWQTAATLGPLVRAGVRLRRLDRTPAGRSGTDPAPAPTSRGDV